MDRQRRGFVLAEDSLQLPVFDRCLHLVAQPLSLPRLRLARRDRRQSSAHRFHWRDSSLGFTRCGLYNGGAVRCPDKLKFEKARR
jgi:hypothetical protein